MAPRILLLIVALSVDVTLTLRRCPPCWETDTLSFLQRQSRSNDPCSCSAADRITPTATLSAMSNEQLTTKLNDIKDQVSKLQTLLSDAKSSHSTSLGKLNAMISNASAGKPETPPLFTKDELELMSQIADTEAIIKNTTTAADVALQNITANQQLVTTYIEKFSSCKCTVPSLVSLGSALVHRSDDKIQQIQDLESQRLQLQAAVEKENIEFSAAQEALTDKFKTTSNDVLELNALADRAAERSAANLKTLKAQLEAAKNLQASQADRLTRAQQNGAASNARINELKSWLKRCGCQLPFA